VTTKNVVQLNSEVVIRHLVLFQLSEEAEGRSKAENARIIKEQLEALQGVIPEIRRIEVKINHEAASDGNYDILLESEFDSLEDLQRYAMHPEHLKVGGYVSKVRTARAAIDYEV
jgi:undecaprenyl pyrophosphate synthase